MLALSSSTGVNLGEAARGAIVQTRHIKHSHDTIPDEVTSEKSTTELHAEYGAKTLIEYGAYGFRLGKCRSETKKNIAQLNPMGSDLANIVCEYAIFKLGIGLCGEFASIAKLYFAKQNVPCVVMFMASRRNLRRNHTFLLIGSFANWKKYFQDNKGKDPNEFFEQLHGMYIVDSLLRSCGPATAFKTSATATYLNNNNIKWITYENSDIWNRDMIRKVEQEGEKLFGLSSKSINENLDELYSQFVAEILALEFQDLKWIKRSKEPFSVWTHGNEADLGVLKRKLAEIGLEAEIKPWPGEGKSHCLLIQKLQFRPRSPIVE